ncbi:MAG: DUF3782 domain-containing protein [Treponema sp.]|nr:DUF3782 domain-containing protein [Treponema sp.]
MASAEALTFEKIWAMFQETDRKFRETSEQIKETREQMRETDRRMKETDRQISRLGNRFGELAEHLVAPNIKEKFRALGFSFEQMSQNIVITNGSRQYLAEIDIMLENGDTVMVVEVKAKPQQKDIVEHVERLEVLRQRADARNDTRKFQGAVAGAIMSDSVRNYAHKTGFYVIEQTGDTVKINIPNGFIPREW